MTTEENPIRIMITDDHPMMLHGLHDILSKYPDIDVKATYKNGTELLEGIRHTHADVLLLDIQLPDIPGDELAAQILDNYPLLKIIILTSFESALYASKLSWMGVQGYLLKNNDGAVLAAAIRSVYRGERYIEQKIKDIMERNPLKSPTILASKVSITKQEKKVLQYIIDGLTDQQIADAMFRSLNTIKHYRFSLQLKLDVNNTATLVGKALKMGLAK